MATINEQLDLMTSLPANWDGYGGDIPSARTIIHAKRVSSSIQRIQDLDTDISVTPSRDGGVLIEWTIGDDDWECEVNPDDTLGILQINRLSGQMTEKVISVEAGLSYDWSSTRVSVNTN